MPNKKILLVGDGNHQFIINLAIWLRKEKKECYQIDVLSFTDLKKENEKIYAKSYGIKSLGFFNKIKGLRTYYRFYLYKKLFKTLPEYDIVNFHYISLDSYFWTDLFKKKTKADIILSIWGSDLYRLKKNNYNNFLKTCQKADKISFTNEKALDYFKEKYSWKKNNIFTLRFGLAPLEELKKINLSKIECKEKLNWNKNKYAIVIGYNLSPYQQHLEILKALNTQKLNELKNDIQLIIPITYGGTLKYKEELIKKLKESSFEFKVYDTFLTDREIAYIRKAADIMLQLQTTDQFSGSMQEHMFANNIVITGSWLPYETLKNQGVWFIDINKISELAEVLPNTILNYGELDTKTIGNAVVIENLSAWGANIKMWITLYSS
mgnify:CR=1 FL=1